MWCVRPEIIYGKTDTTDRGVFCEMGDSMKKPIIGIPLRSEVDENGRCYQYMFEAIRRSIQKAGGLVFPIAPVQDIDYYTTPNAKWPQLTEEEKETIDVYLNMIDGLFIQGGTKFCQYDRYLLDRAIELDKPVLGVCVGMQIMSCYKEDTVAFPKVDNEELHYNHHDNYAHKVTINRDSKLYEILCKEELSVNSFHRRMVSANEIYKTVAVSEDGVIEGLELPGARFNFGVQWHPEIMYEYDENARKIINYFVDFCRENK